MREIRNATGELVEIQITTDDFVDAGLLSTGGIILPGHPLHDVTLNQNLPPDWQQRALDSCDAVCFACKPGSALMTPLSERDLPEYLYGGEYEERLNEIGESLTV